ncbi:MAG: nucleotidyltransferase family protein [Thermoflexales bacterium]|nr:nucleotidyltransferase family protein [Thermoflexales bacterium]MDW8351228.1 hypothetical protein [Anaerolineae bacterium]
MSDSPVPPAIARIAPDGNLTPRQRRRLMIEMLKRRIRPGAGSSHEFMRRRTAIHPWPDLRPILGGIGWALVGGVATRAYMPERATKDLDILVHRDDGDEVMRRLNRAGYQLVSRLAVPGYALRSPTGVEVDVLLGSDPWLKEALERPNYDPAGYPVLGLPYLTLMKLSAQRAQDWADVSRMLGWATDAELDAVRDVIARYSPEDLEDLESLIFLGRQERETSSWDEERPA